MTQLIDNAPNQIKFKSKQPQIKQLFSSVIEIRIINKLMFIQVNCNGEVKCCDIFGGLNLFIFLFAQLFRHLKNTRKKKEFCIL